MATIYTVIRTYVADGSEDGAPTLSPAEPRLRGEFEAEHPLLLYRFHTLELE